MVNVKDIICRTEDCGKYAAFGVGGTKTAEYCRQHASDGMVIVRGNMCGTDGCGKHPSFGVAGTKTAEYCRPHALGGMVNVRRKVRTEDSGMISVFEVAVTKTVDYCAQHMRPRCGVGGCRRGIDPNHSRKESLGVATLSSSKHETVHSPPVQASPLSGDRRVSRKRVRHLHNVPTALERAVVLESAVGAMTMPEIEKQKSPVKRDPSVKTEVHVFL